MKVKLDELDWFKLKAAHGEIFFAESQANTVMTDIRKQCAERIAAKQKAFDALLTAHGFDATKTTRWDDDTHELLQD